MALIRASVGFLTFHLMFWLRKEYGLAEVGITVGLSTVGSMVGNVFAPTMRRLWREEFLLTGALALVAVSGLTAAATGGLATAIVLGFVVNFATSVGRLAFDSIVQRDAPDANQGRAFAQFETRFQLAWVLAGVMPVAFTLPGQVGFFVVGLLGAFAGASYLLGWRAVRAGKPVPPTLAQRAQRRLATEVARRRAASTPPRGQKSPFPPPSGPPTSGRPRP
jgi:MFS family permease